MLPKYNCVLLFAPLIPIPTAPFLSIPKVIPLVPELNTNPELPLMLDPIDQSVVEAWAELVNNILISALFVVDCTIICEL